MSAREARALIRAARTATLATVNVGGQPLATLVAVTDDGRGRPLFLLSGLAEHTRNLRAKPEASVLISGPVHDSLDVPRVTLQGRIAWLEGEEAEEAKRRFTQTHEEAKVWVTLKDFAPARLEIAQVRWVGGFAKAQSLTPAQLAEAEQG